MSRDIIADNIRIARFMGEQFDPTTHNYHSSYDLLIPVLEKIETLHNHGFDVRIGNEHTVIEMMRSSDDGKLHGPIPVAMYGLPNIKRIQHIHGCVIAFLNWLEERHRSTDTESETENS